MYYQNSIFQKLDLNLQMDSVFLEVEEMNQF